MGRVYARLPQRWRQVARPWTSEPHKVELPQQALRRRSAGTSRRRPARRDALLDAGGGGHSGLRSAGARPGEPVRAASGSCPSFTSPLTILEEEDHRGFSSRSDRWCGACAQPPTRSYRASGGPRPRGRVVRRPASAPDGAFGGGGARQDNPETTRTDCRAQARHPMIPARTQFWLATASLPFPRPTMTENHLGRPGCFRPAETPRLNMAPHPLAGNRPGSDSATCT